MIRFSDPVINDHDQERQRLLRRLLSPFLLRRTKDDVLNELPEKTEIIRLHQNKRSLADALLEDADMFSQISADDVIRLLREGVDAIN